MIFETHAHYDDRRFDEDRDELLLSMEAQGIGPIVNVGASLSSCKTTLELTKKYPFVYGALGIHPSDIEDLNEESFAWIRENLSNDKIVAVGEIGLDYYWEKDLKVRAEQREWFARQLELAREAKLPVIIHSRDAAEDTLAVMREQKAHEIPGVVHCYSYSKELAREFVKMGYYIGVGGVVTFKNAKKLVETVEELPLDRLLLETDCPYMAPEPHRGKRNHSGYLIHVVEKVAQIRGLSQEEVIAITRENAYRLFQMQ